VEAGTIHKLPKVAGGDLVTLETFKDFEFAWEWKLALGGNNGVKYLVDEERPSAPGHEYQMLDDERHEDARRGPKRRTAAFYDVLSTDTGATLRPAGQWNQSRLVVLGNRVEHWLNGAMVLEYELGSDWLKSAIELSKFKGVAGFGSKLRGRLMLTDHRDECWFRNLKVRGLTAP
jgi:hypothetical protein